MKPVRTFVNETTLSRVFGHFQSDNAVAILTAFRGGNTYEENAARNKQLAAKIKNAGYGHFILAGHWVEESGHNEDDTSEDSIFVVGSANDNGKLKGLCKKWGNEFDQDAALFKNSGNREVVFLFNDGRTTSIENFKVDEVAEAYMKLRARAGRTFVFESAFVEKNWLGKWAESISDAGAHLPEKVAHPSGSISTPNEI